MTCPVHPVRSSWWSGSDWAGIPDCLRFHFNPRPNYVRGQEWLFCLLALNWNNNIENCFKNYVIRRRPRASSDKVIKCVNKAACVVIDVWSDNRSQIAMIKPLVFAELRFVMLRPSRHLWFIVQTQGLLVSLSFLVIAFHISFNFNDLLNINLSVFRLI